MLVLGIFDGYIFDDVDEDDIKGCTPFHDDVTV